MKKLFTTMLTVLASGAAFALPVGNPSEASLLCDGVCWEGHCGDMCDPCLTWCDAFSFRVGFYGDYVFQRHLRAQGDREADPYYNHFTISTNAGYVAANFWDRVDIFGTMGASNWSATANGSTFRGTIGSYVTIFSETDFSWSVGARGTIWECGCTSLGAEFQYFQTHCDLHKIIDMDAGVSAAAWVDGQGTDSVYSEWQIGVGVSHRIHCFVPYIAVKWDVSQLEMDEALISVATRTLHLFDSKSDNSWGYAVGVSIVDCEKASLTAEGRFGNETAAYVNGQFRF